MHNQDRRYLLRSHRLDQSWKGLLLVVEDFVVEEDSAVVFPHRHFGFVDNQYHLLVVLHPYWFDNHQMMH
jgi:hypothetical protein